MRRFALGFAASIAFVALGYSILWYHFARELEAGLPAWAEARRAEGYDIAWRTVEAGGFPLALTLRLDGASLHAARPFPYALAAGTLRLETRPWNWRKWRFAAPQGASLDLPSGGASFATVRLDGTASAGADGLDVAAKTGALTGSGLADGFSAASLEAHLALPLRAPQADRDPLATLGAKLADTVLPQAPAAVRQLDALSFAVTMRGAMPGGPIEGALAQWRDGGGTLDLDALHLARGGAAADLEGTLALDETLQPEGALTATLSGGDKIIDGLVASGALKARFAGFAKTVLGAISNSDDPGTLRVPITLQDQRLYIGPAEVAALPRFTWR